MEAIDENCHQVQRKYKEKILQIDDRVFIRRIQKKGESKLIAPWQGPYRVIAQKNPGVYKLKEILTGKVTEQHIENIKSKKLIMAREAEIPLSECPRARLPFPLEQVPEGRQLRKLPEGAPEDDWYDDSFWLTPVEQEEAVRSNTLPTQEEKASTEEKVVRRVSPRTKSYLRAN